MIEAIRSDLAAYPVERALTVTLGDYVDRGPDSRGVVERLAENPFPTEYVALKGNHEEMLVPVPARSVHRRACGRAMAVWKPCIPTESMSGQ